MNGTLRRVLGLQEHELKGGKLRPEVVVYLNPEQVGNDRGCHCGACFFYIRPQSECFLTAPPACNAEHGVCAFFLRGPSGVDKRQAAERVSKETAGYVEDGPTRCGNCEYFERDGEGGCKKVGGVISAQGCCAHWEPGDESDK